MSIMKERGTQFREVTRTRWIVSHSTPDGKFTIEDNFLDEDAANSFAERQKVKGRIVNSIDKNDNFRLDY